MSAEEPHLLSLLDLSRVPCEHGGDLAMRLAVTEGVKNSRGGLQGGLVATLVDIVAGIAVNEALPAGLGAATSDLTLHFLSAVTVGPAHAEASILRRGRRLSVVTIEVYDVGRDVLAAVSTASFATLELRPGQTP
ncbi:MAG TPA: PaaI family thioesterase [Mycobacteriales bacterium]|nr:PaaI family thioesterase [Mycobacteriales bacterium]